MADLLQRLMSTWAGFRQNVVDEAVDQRQKDSLAVFVNKEVTSNSCSDIGCRVFHDCIKRVDSVTFLTLSYCCKLLK